MYNDFCILFYDILQGNTLSEEVISLIGDITSIIIIMTSVEPTSGISDSELICMNYFILIAGTIRRSLFDRSCYWSCSVCHYFDDRYVNNNTYCLCYSR